MNRRCGRVLAAAMVSAAAVAAAGLARTEGVRAGPAPAPAGPPNIVVVMTDDQGPQMMKALPFTQRAIGGRGVSFSRAFASYPLCCPSRASFLTGQYAHNHGALGNTKQSGGGYQALIEPERTLASWLRAAGYETAFAGKWLNGLRSPRSAPPGWDRWAGLIGGGGEGLSSYYDYDVFEPGGEPRHFGDADSDYQTDALTREYALPLIDAHAADAQPFFLWLALHPPHDGLGRDDRAGRRCSAREPDERGGGQSAIPPPRYADRFARARVPKPPSFDERDVSDKPAFVRRRQLLSRAKLEKIERDYRCGLAALLSVDDTVRELTAALARTGQLQNTVLVFTADQGLLAGEHRLRGKNQPYEEAIRVPLLIRGPGVGPGREVTEPVANVDLAPTLLELAGASIPAALERTIDGVSLAPLLAGTGGGQREAILIEGRKEATPSRRGFKVRSYIGVRTRRFAYVEHHRAAVDTAAAGIGVAIGAGRVTDRELYDLRRDPFELESRHRDRTYAATRRSLSRLLSRLESCAGAACAPPPMLSPP